MSARYGRWVTFDCLGTLVDWRASFARVLSPYVGEAAGEVIEAYCRHQRAMEQAYPYPAYKRVVVAALTQAAAERGIELPPAEAAAVLRSWEAMEPFADAEEMLATLRADGWRLAILTNCDEDLFAITRRRFRTPLDFVLTGDRVRGYKPAPWHFQAFARLSGATGGEWVHVGSSWRRDVEPARALAIPHVWLDRAGSRAGDTGARVRSAADVAAAVTGVARSAVAAC